MFYDLCKCFLCVQVFCNLCKCFVICASVFYLCKCFLFVQVFSICASAFYLCKCFVPMSHRIFQRARVAWHVLRQSYGMRTLAYPTLCITMSLCSFASLVGRACSPSRENPNAVRGDRDVKAHLKLCNNILTDIESIDSERKLVLSRAGESTGKVIFSVIERRLTCKSYKLLTHLLLLL